MTLKYLPCKVESQMCIQQCHLAGPAAFITWQTDLVPWHIFFRNWVATVNIITSIFPLISLELGYIHCNRCFPLYGEVKLCVSGHRQAAFGFGTFSLPSGYSLSFRHWLKVSLFFQPQQHSIQTLFLH